ncbi:MAG: DUF4145 domain-containing protein [Rhodothermaceae bacterium]|nr:DUF4145 domain-containing protein [Rhodothermaceae bacterium]MXZ57744.1 DUF4145 domain-containing protein [Rhodothermaceae bacterium]MYB91744.1 DUF4145 domain-containing protein [Rhodothermaceae bacterium]MYD67542.1 DUF4145 domain-containing protein [Rhodothermaceae bacterium]MYG45551.1 DUF4145 domain-containing protein [Rhodothermaceae bacterium]
MPSHHSAQRKLLDEIIHKIRDWQPGESSFEPTVIDWVIKLQTLADHILPNHIADSLNAIDVDIDDPTCAFWAKSKLDAFVPIIEDALASISRGGVPPPNPDLPDNITRDYEEAATIVELSPRGAAALLRLCIQNLCIHLGEPGKRLNKDIGELVAKGLDGRVQQALDTVRVLGNEAVHPGTLDLKDDHQTVKKMFALVNMIAKEMITLPRERDDLFNTLPENKREDIDKRDKEVKAAASRSRRAD